MTFGIGKEDCDQEGRTIVAEYPEFYVVGCYVPNAGQGLKRLKYRIGSWDKQFRVFMEKLDSKKPVILCGDLNCAHKEIDIANPKGNKRSAGFTIEEREEFSKLLNMGYVDTFRDRYPTPVLKLSNCSGEVLLLEHEE